MQTFLILGILFSWYIRDFDVRIEPSKENLVNVSEVITVDFEDEQRHGIFRTIPSYFRGHPIGLKVHSVQNLTNGSYAYKLSHSYKDVYIRIGDKDVFVSGIQKYKIDYSMRYVVFDTAGVDRLMWNVTGNEWPVHIEHARFEMPVTQNIPLPKNIKCFTGPIGSREHDCSCTTLQNSIVCETNQSLFYYEGMTVLMDFPEGTFKMPGIFQKILWKFSFLWPVLIPIIAFVGMYIMWWKYGRDPKTGPVVASYEPPNNLTPIETGTLIDESVDSHDLTAEILNLALKGYIKIEEVPIKDEYIITKLKDCDENIKPFQCKILKGLFSHGNVKDLLKKLKEKQNEPEYKRVIESIERCNEKSGCEVIALSSLKNKFYVVFNDVSGDIYEELTKRGYFPENPDYVRGKYMVNGILLIFFSFVFWFLKRRPSFKLLGWFSMVAAGAIIIIFGNFLPRKTKKGAEAVRKIKGLLEFIHRTEKDRLKKFALENPEMFKNLLPYAIALGEEEKWAEVFEEVYEVLRKRTSLNTVYISGGFASMISTMSTNATSTPSSSGSGSGSGAGFSGGGAGGGGGGAW